MVLVRAGEDRDIPAVAALASQMTANYRFAAIPSADFLRYSLSKKRLLAGFSSPGALTVDFYIVEEGAGAVAFAILTSAGEEDVVLEMCGDRDPNGARVGALLQVLRARIAGGRRADYPRRAASRLVAAAGDDSALGVISVGNDGEAVA